MEEQEVRSANEEEAIATEADGLATPGPEPTEHAVKKARYLSSLDLMTVIKEFKDFYPEFQSRILLNHRRRIERIIRDFEVSIGNYVQKFERNDVKGCLGSIQAAKKFMPHHLPNEAIKYFKELFTYDEIATLFGCTLDNIASKHRTQIKREERAEEERTRSLGIPNLPISMKDKPPEEITDEEAAQLAKIVLIRRVLENNDLEAASKLVGIFNQTVKTESLKKWQQLKEMDEFYMSKFLPTLQKHVASAGLNIDVKIIVKKILSDLSESMKGKVKEALENPELDEMVRKAKRRGKHFKEAR